MKVEFQTLLDKMINNNEIMDYIDGQNLAQYLQITNVISIDEQDTLEQMPPRKSARHLVSVVLKTKLDSDMFHFLACLKDANYKHAHQWLEEQLANPSLDNLGMGCYAVHPSVRSKSVFVSKEKLTACMNAKDKPKDVNQSNTAKSEPMGIYVGHPSVRSKSLFASEEKWLEEKLAACINPKDKPKDEIHAYPSV